ncbi:guanine permease [Lottiidibacillus patelloidae]|uniref:Guanine permease n=1 Tax=Lottiidibacillus patelloidae TaxID=2670334 RepID=A0A263BSV5_9BACI|nr:NCS2 family permease [Lottiidibacillus patelloidae]OZM56811.1 guanine permease [Lottiidibacillus patelloidae]
MFKLKENRTNTKTELLAGFTTFLTMVYIIVVNPSILEFAGVPFQTAFMATIIAAVLGTLWMALFANYPIAIAPGMGLNAYFAFYVVGNSETITYETAFSAVFVAGIIFVLLSLTKFREVLINAIPANLKYAITAGIGLFIAFIGLRMTGLVVANEQTLVTLGNLQSPTVLLSLFGLFVTLVFIVLRVPGALFVGMIATAIVAYFTDYLVIATDIFAVPSMPDLVISNPLLSFVDVFNYGLYAVVFAFLLVTLFDTTGTMIGVAEQAGLTKNNKLPKAKQALLADSVATSVGAMFGTSPTTAYIESSSGVAAGGRTGLTTFTVAMLFIVAAFFSPLVGAVSNVAAITAPALIIVGSYMMVAIGKITWNEFDEAFPAFLVILAMPLTSSIATGIAFGFIAYPILKIFSGKWRQVHYLLYIFALLFIYLLAFVQH